MLPTCRYAESVRNRAEGRFRPENTDNRLALRSTNAGGYGAQVSELSFRSHSSEWRCDSGSRSIPFEQPSTSAGIAVSFGSASHGMLPGHTCTEPGRDQSYYVPGSTPVYPADLAKHGVGGMVMLQMRVSATGLVTNIHISRTSGYPELDAAALAAVSHWKYSPGTVDGVPVDADGFAFVNFRPK